MYVYMYDCEITGSKTSLLVLWHASGSLGASLPANKTIICTAYAHVRTSVAHPSAEGRPSKPTDALPAPARLWMILLLRANPAMQPIPR